MRHIVSLATSCCFFFFKQKTAYELRISDWSSDVCSSDLPALSATIAYHKFDSDIGDLDYGQEWDAQVGFKLLETAVLLKYADFDSSGFGADRSEEHTSELQSLMRISYAVFCLKNKRNFNSKQNMFNVSLHHQNKYITDHTITSTDL